MFHDIERLKTLFNQGSFSEAHDLAIQLLNNNTLDVDVLIIFSRLKLIQGLYLQSCEFALKAFDIDPSNEEIHFLLGKVYGQLGKSKLAIEWIDKFLVNNKESALGWIEKASVLERMGDIDGSILAVNKSKKFSNDPLLYLTSSRCYKQIGDLERALDEIESGLSLAEKKNTSVAIISKLTLEKARLCDSMKRYEEAFRYAKKSRSVLNLSFNKENYILEIDQIINIFTHDFLMKNFECQSNSTNHVFIAGMPRSGTTLIEQILDSHSQVIGLGEMKEINFCLRNFSRA